MSLKEMVDSLVEEPRYKIDKRDLKFQRFEKQEKFNFDIPQTTDEPPEHYGRNKVVTSQLSTVNNTSGNKGLPG